LQSHCTNSKDKRREEVMQFVQESNVPKIIHPQQLNFKRKHNKHFKILTDVKEKDTQTSDQHTIEDPQTQCLHKNT